MSGEENKSLLTPKSNMNTACPTGPQAQLTNQIFFCRRKLKMPLSEALGILLVLFCQVLLVRSCHFGRCM